MPEVRLSSRFEQALVYAQRLHSTQVRKGGDIPYIAHLLNVTGIALTYGASEDEAIAALLHDAVEDQGGHATEDEIKRQFGADVAGIVRECSDTDVLPKPPWRERKEAYIAALARASSSALLVSAADKLDNVRAILADYRLVGEELWSRFSGGREGTLWYYRAIVCAYRSAGAKKHLVDELDLAVSELERLTGRA